MKRKLTAVLATLMLCLAAVTGFGLWASAVSYDVYVVVNGADVDFSGGLGRPFISDENRTMVPVRGVAEQYGCEVQWDHDNYQVIVTYGSHYAVLPVNTPYVYTDSGTRVMDTTARIIDGRTYIPIRFVMEAMGASVSWDGDNNIVIIENPDTYVNPVTVLKEHIKANGSYFEGMYLVTIPDSPEVTCTLAYEPDVDDLYVFVNNEDKKEGYHAYGRMYLSEPFYDLGWYTSTFTDTDTYESSTISGFFLKNGYSSSENYDISESDADVYSHTALMKLACSQVKYAASCLDDYCASHHLGITSADFGLYR